MSEDRLDHRLSAAIQGPAKLGLQDVAHELVASAVPAGSARGPVTGVGRDEDLDAVLAHQLVHLLLMPVAGVPFTHRAGSIRVMNRLQRIAVVVLAQTRHNSGGCAHGPRRVLGSVRRVWHARRVGEPKRSDRSGAVLDGDARTSVRYVFEDGSRREVSVTLAEAAELRAQGEPGPPTRVLPVVRRLGKPAGALLISLLLAGAGAHISDG